MCTRPLLVAAALALLLAPGCKRTAPEARAVVPPSAEEADFIAKELAKYLTPCDTGKLRDLIDTDMIVDRAIAGRAIGKSDMSELRSTLVQTMCASLDPSWRAVHIRTNVVAGVPRPIVRLVGEEGMEYLELVLDKTDKHVRVADFYVYTRGEHMSQTMTRIVDTLLAANRSAALDHAQELQRIQHAINRKDYRSAYDTIQRMPAELRTQKHVMLSEIRAASGLDDNALYIKSIDAYAKQFPDDPSLDLVLIDGAFLGERYAEVLELLDKLDKRIGGDPYLDTMRAGTQMQAGKLAEAVDLAKRATSREPDLAEAWRTLLAAQVAAGHHRGAMQTLATVQTKLGELKDEASLRADPRFAALADTAEYQKRR